MRAPGQHVSRVKGRRVVLIGGLVVVLLFAVAFFANAPTASGQGSCATGLFEVSTGAEFNAAIDCYNSPDRLGPVVINLLNDIESDTIAGDAVFRPIQPRGEISITSEGLFTLRRSASAPTTQVPILLLLDGTGLGSQGEDLTSTLTALQIGIELGSYDTAGIQTEGPNVLQLDAIAITVGSNGSAGTGILNSYVGPITRQLVVTNSLIEGMSIGIKGRSGRHIIDRSTISSTNTDTVFDGDEFVIILNSTLAGPVGIEFKDDRVNVEYSTIVGDGAKPAAGATGVVIFRHSNLIGSCSGD